MKNSERFLKRLFRTSEATDKEVIKFMIEEYFLQDKTFSDFEDDLEQIHNYRDSEAMLLVNCFKNDLRKYAKGLKYFHRKGATV